MVVAVEDTNPPWPYIKYTTIIEGVLVREVMQDAYHQHHYCCFALSLCKHTLHYTGRHVYVYVNGRVGR